MPPVHRVHGFEESQLVLGQLRRGRRATESGARGRNRRREGPWPERMTRGCNRWPGLSPEPELRGFCLGVEGGGHTAMLEELGIPF